MSDGIEIWQQRRTSRLGILHAGNGSQVQADNGAYDYPYGGTASVSTLVEEMENHARRQGIV